VRIRPLEAADVEVVAPLWAAGFAEMGPLMYDSIRRSPVTALVALAAVAGALAARAWVTAGLLAAGAAALYTPALGGALLQRLLAAGIESQRRRDMTPDTIFRTWRVPGASEFLVAVAGGRIVGCVAVAAHHTLHKERAAGVPARPGEASVWRLSVDPSARRLRIGRRLMDAAEAWAAAHGATAVTLVTGNVASKQFYRRIGYATESMPRARHVLFGPAGAHPVGWLDRARHLRLSSRLHPSSGTVFVKHLPPPAPAAEPAH